MVTAKHLCEVMGGRLIQGDPETKIKGIMCRCSKVKAGQLYFDVKGGRGGDDNILEAINNGAKGVVISKHKKRLPFEDETILVIAVPKVWEAFWQWVKFYREGFDIPVVGVTGTSGKTTTKEMIASIFRSRWKTLKTIGNMNLPDFVPSHIMRLRYGYQAAVFEIGMNRPGHISKQSKVIQPKVGVITHIGHGHVQPLGGFDNVVLEKAGIIQGILEDGFLVLNADDLNTKKIDLSGFTGKIIYYGLKNSADYMAREIQFNKVGTRFKVILEGKERSFFIPTFGEHNVYNALAAVTVAQIFGFSYRAIKNGLAGYRKPYMRLQVINGIKNSTLINDTYNANPDSMMAGLEVLAMMAKGKPGIAVLGNMLEQGSMAKKNHRLVGKKAAELKIDWLVTVGRLAQEIAKGALENSNTMKIWSFYGKQQAISFLKENIPSDSVVLFKGSRGAHMEILVKRLKKVDGLS
jgi:UDP-N-acetylmuramoyl-tripeptide--D-alanyl-D-alanine ligase